MMIFVCSYLSIGLFIGALMQKALIFRVMSYAVDRDSMKADQLEACEKMASFPETIQQNMSLILCLISAVLWLPLVCLSLKSIDELKSEFKRILSERKYRESELGLHAVDTKVYIVSLKSAIPVLPYKGKSCERTGIRPGRIYRSKTQAIKEAYKLHEDQPGAFKVVELKYCELENILTSKNCVEENLIKDSEMPAA